MTEETSLSLKDGFAALLINDDAAGDSYFILPALNRVSISFICICVSRLAY